MAIMQGMGTCLVPKDSGVPCGSQIEEGDPIRTITLAYGGYVIGHRACVDAYEARKSQELDEDMVKRVDQAGPGGAVDMRQAKDALVGSVPLEQQPGKPPVNGPKDLSEVAWTNEVRSVAEVPMGEPPPIAGQIREFTPAPDPEEPSLIHGSLDDEIENQYTYHAPSEQQIELYRQLRESGKYLAYLIVNNCPESRERSLARTKLEEAVMWANAAIARHG